MADNLKARMAAKAQQASQQGLNRAVRDAALRESGGGVGVPTVWLDLDQIVVDQQIQVRVGGLNAAKVEQYALAMSEGAQFPPVVVFREGDQLYLAGGFHRYAAAEMAGISSIEAEVRPGGRDAAIEFAEEDNLEHGLELTTADKQNIFERRFRRGHEWIEWSTRAIAARLGVAESTVRNWRQAYAAKTTAADEIEMEPEKREQLERFIMLPFSQIARLIDSLPDEDLPLALALELGQPQPRGSVTSLLQNRIKRVSQSRANPPVTPSGAQICAPEDTTGQLTENRLTPIPAQEKRRGQDGKSYPASRPAPKPAPVEGPGYEEGRDEQADRKEDLSTAFQISTRLERTSTVIIDHLRLVRTIRGIRTFYALDENRIKAVDQTLYDLLGELSATYEHIQALRDKMQRMYETGRPYDDD